MQPTVIMPLVLPLIRTPEPFYCPRLKMIQIEYYPGSFTQKDLSKGPLFINLAFCISHTNLTPCATYGPHHIDVTHNQDTPTILMTRLKMIQIEYYP